MRPTVSPLIKMIMLTILLMVITIIAANNGGLSLSFSTLWHSQFNDTLWQIWIQIRLPRILLALLVGAALAVSGVIMQGLFRNPLADPGLLGISSGAALAVALSIILPLSLPLNLILYGQFIAAFMGSLAISLVIFSINKFTRGQLAKLLLTGIAINALCMSLVGVFSYISNDQQLRQYTLWVMGSLGQVQWPTLTVAFLVTIPVLLFSLRLARPLNLLQLGDEEAHYLGINVKKTKLILLLLSSVLIGISVALCGVIGFIGLVIPHLIRLRFGADHRWVIPACALGGAALLLTADTLARTTISPAELPVGLLTGLIGGPYFLWLILRSPRG